MHTKTQKLWITTLWEISNFEWNFCHMLLHICLPKQICLILSYVFLYWLISRCVECWLAEYLTVCYLIAKLNSVCAGNYMTLTC